MRDQQLPVMDIFPREQQEVFLEDPLNVFLAEALADGAAVFVIHNAGGLVKHLPAALPSQITQVRVFQIEGLVKMIEATQLQKLAAVESAGAAASVEAR